MPDKTKSIVKIAGVDYTIVSDESAEYIQKVGLHVDRTIRNVLSKNKRLSTAMASLLTSINIADEYMREREGAERQKAELLKANAELLRVRASLDQAKQRADTLEREVQRLRLELANKNGQLSK